MIWVSLQKELKQDMTKQNLRERKQYMQQLRSLKDQNMWEMCNMENWKMKIEIEGRGKWKM